MSNINRNFGRLDDGRLVYAPAVLWISGSCFCTPTAAQYAEAGWLPVTDEQPSGKVGVAYVPTGWEEREGVIRRVYEERPIVAPPVVYVVEEIVYQLIATGRLQATKAVVGDYWELLTMRDRVTADNPYWSEAFPQVCAGLIAAGVFADRAEIDALLAKCREGYVDEDSDSGNGNVGEVV